MAHFSKKISCGEKKLFLATGFAIALLIGIGAWRSYVDAIPNIKIPVEKLPSPNAFDFYAKAGAALVLTKSAVDPVLDTVIVPPSQWKTRYPTRLKEKWLRANASALRLLRQGVKYSCRVPTQSPYGIKGTFRTLARTLIIESDARGERGEWNSAAQSVLDIMKLGHDVQHGVLLDALVGYAINAIGRRRMWQIMPHLSADQARLVARRLEQLHQSRASFGDILRAEKFGALSQTIASMREGNWESGIEYSIEYRHNEDSTPQKILYRLRDQQTPRRVVLESFVNYMDTLAQATKQPYAKRKLPPIPTDSFNEMMTPVYERSVRNQDRDHADNSLLIAALALRAYELDHKRRAVSLTQLVPQYLNEVPRDIFGSGRSLHYRLNSKTHEMILYSIGPDGVDNGGRPIEDKSRNGRSRFLVWDGKGDFVAGINY